MATRPELDDHELFRRNSRSFFWASRLLPPEAARDAATLYRFCREVDDLADEGGEPGQRRLAGIARDLERGDGSDPLARHILDLAERRRLDLSAARALIAAVRTDGPGLRVSGWRELERYCYGVASTVGLLMCPILGVRESEALPFAVDLGLAMQLTNMARDVLEDARNDRVYLPRECVGELDPGALCVGDGSARKQAWGGVLALLDRAHSFYRSADRGLRFIPRGPRRAILVASRIYEQIGHEIRRRGPQRYWRARTVVGTWTKIAVTTRALASTALRWPAGQHDASLHEHLVGLPGVDPEAL